MKGANPIKAQSNREALDAACEDAELGICLANLQADYFHTGFWNGRKIKQPAVTSLMTSFDTSGMNFKAAKSAIAIVVKRHEVDTASLCTRSEIRIPGKLVEVRWTATREPQVQIANGNHRREAQRMYMLRKEKELKQAQLHVSSLSAAGDTPESREEVAKAITYRDQQAAYLATLGLWAAIIYDYGTPINCDLAVCNVSERMIDKLDKFMLDHISRNSTDPEYGETVEEILARALQPLIDADEKDDLNPREGAAAGYYYNEAREAMIAHPDVNGCKVVRRLLYSKSLPLTIGSLGDLSPIFIGSQFYNLTRLGKLQGIYSGVSYITLHDLLIRI